MQEDVLIRIGAEAQPVNRAMADAQRHVARARGRIGGDLRQMDAGFRTHFGNVQNTVQKTIRLLGVFGVALGGVQFTRFIRGGLDAAGGLGELAEQLGTTTRNLQIYQFAAAQAGVSQRELEQGLQRLTRNMGDLAIGESNEATKAFERLGVSVTDTSGRMRSTDAVMADLADKIGAMPDPAERAAAAYDLFGRSGQRLLPILSQGSAGLTEFGIQASRAGAILTEEQIAAADKASDAMARLGFQATKVGQQFAIEFAEPIARAAEYVAENMREIVRGVAAVAGALAGLIALKAATVFAALAGSVLTFAKAMTAAARASVLVNAILSRTVLGVVAKLAVTLGGGALAWEMMGAEAVGAIEATEGAVAALEGSVGGVVATTDKVRESTQALRYSAEQTRQLIAALGRGQGAYQDLREEIELENEANKQNIDLTTQAGQEWLEAAKANRVLEKQLGRTLKVHDEQAQAAKRAADEALRDQERRAEDHRRAVERSVDSVVDYAGNTFADMFSDTEFSWKKMWDNLRQTAIQTLARMAAEVALRPIIAPIVASFMGATAAGSAASASGGGGLSGGLFGGGGLLGNLGSFASLAQNTGIAGKGGILSSIGGGIGSFLSTPLYSTQATGLIGTVNVPGLTVGGALGAAGLGAVGGGLIAQLTGGNQIGGSIGGGLGAVAGTIVGGPIGGIIGGAAGGFLGGMFGGGGQSVGPIGHTNIVNRGGRLAVGSSGADNGATTEATIQAAQQAVQALNALADRFELTIRSAGPGMISQGAASGPQSADAFVSQFVAGRGFGSDSATQAAILRNVQASSIEALTEALEFGEFYDSVVAAEPALTQVEQAMRELSETFRTASDRAKDFGLSVSDLTDGFRTSFERDVADAIRAIEDPFGLALELNARDAEARLEMAKELGADLAEVERLNALERQKVVEESLGNLRAWLDGQAITSGATTGVGRLAEAQGQFGDVLDAIRGGDRTQANLSRVTSLADTIIGLGAEIWGGTAQRAALEQMVRSQVEEIGRLMDVPGFAAGGVHDGGWRIVGERGPELEFTGPSRIMSASQTREAMGSGLTREDARMLVRFMADAANGNRQVVAAVDGMSDRIDRLSRDVSRVLTSQTQQRRAG